MNFCSICKRASTDYVCKECRYSAWREELKDSKAIEDQQHQLAKVVANRIDGNLTAKEFSRAVLLIAAEMAAAHMDER